MKAKLFFLSVLSLAGIAASAAPALAWHPLRHRCNRYSTVVVCRPYNAFTPVCYGSMVCDGCCPFACPTAGPGASCSAFLGNPLLGLGGHDMAALNGPYVAHPSMYLGAPMPPAGQGAAPAVNVFQPPPPLPANTQTYAAPPAGYQVNPTHYQNQQAPLFYPILPAAPMQQAPSYWYGR